MRAIKARYQWVGRKATSKVAPFCRGGAGSRQAGDHESAINLSFDAHNRYSWRRFGWCRGIMDPRSLWRRRATSAAGMWRGPLCGMPTGRRTRVSAWCWWISGSRYADVRFVIVRLMRVHAVVLYVRIRVSYCFRWTLPLDSRLCARARFSLRSLRPREKAVRGW